MNPIHKILRSSAIVGISAERAMSRAPRSVSSVKPAQSVVTSNRAFIRAWVARRAKLAVGKPRPSK